MATTSPYGSWASSISAETVTRAGTAFADVIRLDAGTVYWVESRPLEGGRSALVRLRPDGAPEDVGPPDFDARTRVHEYGGAAFTVVDGVVIASRFSDQRLYRIEGDADPRPITPEPTTPAALRYADLDVSGTLAVAVREDHTTGGEPRNELVVVDLTGDEAPRVLATGADFYMAPRLSPDARTLAWIEWDHPNMPWDGTRLCRAPFDPAGLGPVEVVAGTEDESVIQPAWSPDGALHWISDISGWWNLYREGQHLHAVDADMGGAPWVFGLQAYGFTGDGAVAGVSTGVDHDSLVVIAPSGVREVTTHTPVLGAAVIVDGQRVLLHAGGPDSPLALVAIDLETGATRVLHAVDSPIDPVLISTPETITFDTPDGPAHAQLYRPHNPEFSAPDGDLPPLIVNIHGGPTARARRTLRPSFQFWTSRGFAIVDVDYGGSSGYGRAYRNRLRGQWGVVDVRDCALAAAHVAALGLADPDRLLITGGSAGGYTTLLALATRDEFAAGTSAYGISDLAPLAASTHKFESRYLDRLVGPLPEAADVYRERSALGNIDSFRAPVLLLQGGEDRVVTPDQAEMMREALVERGVPVAYLLFEGEGHGFRDAVNQVAALEAELSFYGQVLGFEPADDITPVEIVG